MTTVEFNALPLEARRFIELHAGCLSCGNAESKLTRAYELYKSNRMANVYVLFGGGINYAIGKQRGVLYNVSDQDSPLEIREKLDIAARINEVSPHVFMSYDEKAIAELLASLPEAEVVDLRTDEEKAAAEAKEAEEKAAAEAWTERSEILGIDTKTADYEVLKAFATEKALTPAGKKKIDLIAAIDAIVIEDLD